MSQYLIQRIRRLPNVEVRTRATIAAADGRGRLERITVKDLRTGSTEAVPCDGLFIFIGATPRTDWLAGAVRRDQDGFISSGADVSCDISQWPEWQLDREPYRLETSMPGVFVAGDVRNGSIKRLAAAAGEGTMAIQYVHQYCRSALQQQETPSPPAERRDPASATSSSASLS